MFSWNALGIIIWVIIIIYLLFIIQNIRNRHLLMIIKDHKRFEWKTFLLDLIEVVVLLVAGGLMIMNMFFDNLRLDDKSTLTAKVEYRPLILTPSNTNSYYVTDITSKQKVPVQTYQFYIPGKKITLNSNNASISYGINPQDIASERIPYTEKELKEMDSKYQKAYVAIYTARYKDTWKNGLALHANKVATQYYLIRIPDRSFIKQK